MGMTSRPPVTITEAAILLRIPVLYDADMSSDALTRYREDDHGRDVASGLRALSAG